VKRPLQQCDRRPLVAGLAVTLRLGAKRADDPRRVDWSAPQEVASDHVVGHTSIVQDQRSAAMEALVVRVPRSVIRGSKLQAFPVAMDATGGDEPFNRRDDRRSIEIEHGGRRWDRGVATQHARGVQHALLDGLGLRHHLACHLRPAAGEGTNARSALRSFMTIAT
jgi:hypothetical protein